MINNWTTDNILIGQMAKMHNISSKMLRYWDRIGILKPAATNEVNGYRYYTSQQFHVLKFILYMRSLGLSYEEIKKGLNNINENSLQELLDSQIDLTIERIQELEKVKNKLENMKTDLDNALKIQQTGDVILEKQPERKIITLDSTIITRLEFEKTIQSLEDKIGNDFHCLVSEVGLIMNKKNFENGIFDVFNGIFLFDNDCTICEKMLKSLPAGDFATIYFWGKTEDSSDYLNKLMNFIRRHNYTITGDLLRTVVATGMRMDDRGHLAQIQVPVKPA